MRAINEEQSIKYSQISFGAPVKEETLVVGRSRYCIGSRQRNCINARLYFFVFSDSI